MRRERVGNKNVTYRCRLTTTNENGDTVDYVVPDGATVALEFRTELGVIRNKEAEVEDGYAVWTDDGDDPSVLTESGTYVISAVVTFVDGNTYRSTGGDAMVVAP